jgi:phospholipase/carboxylesterase
MIRSTLILGTLSALLLTSCAGATIAEGDFHPGKLDARPRASAAPCDAGQRTLTLSSGPDAYLYVPPSAAGKPAPLLVFLHGAGGSAARMIEYVRPIADEYGMVALVPGSSGATWDGIRDEPGVDARRIDEALAATFESCAIDRRRIAMGGFSDGASYALTIGLGNGDLFTHVIAFAPCGVSRSVKLAGQPRVFVSHGVNDAVLPIDRCGRPIVAAMKRKGYDVRYVEFQGKHEIPENIGRDAFDWFTGRRR